METGIYMALSAALLGGCILAVRELPRLICRIPSEAYGLRRFRISYVFYTTVFFGIPFYLLMRLVLVDPFERAAIATAIKINLAILGFCVLTAVAMLLLSHDQGAP